MNAVCYLRISTVDQSAYSLDNQRREVENYCKKYGLNIVDTFTDNGESSYSFDRADFKKLEAYIKKNRPQFIIVYHLDRFSRNLSEALQKTRELISKFNVRVRDITEPLDLDDNDPNTFMIRSFRFMMAENELHRIRQRTKSGMLQGAMSGRHLNMAPYGYTNARDAADKPILLVNEERAAHVQLIFRQFVAGHSIETVKTLAKAIGYSQKGSSAIQRILTNQIYIGKIKLPGGNYTQGLHQPIISDYDFWQAQSLLNGGKKIVQQPKEEVYLRGILKDFNNHPMTAGRSKGKSNYYWYYVSKIAKKNYPAIKLHNQFLEILRVFEMSQREIDWFKSKLKGIIEDKISSKENEIKLLAKSLSEVQKQIAIAEEKYILSPSISPTVFESTINKLRSKESIIQKQLVEVEQPSGDLLKKLDAILPIISNLGLLFEKLPLHKKQQFIRVVFNQGIAYYSDSYRTPSLHPLFASKAALLKEKGLLTIEQPVINFGIKPVRTPDGSPIELLDSLYSIFAA